MLDSDYETEFILNQLASLVRQHLVSCAKIIRNLSLFLSFFLSLFIYLSIYLFIYLFILFIYSFNLSL